MFAAADMVPTMWLPTATTVAMTGLVTIPRRIANYKSSKTTLGIVTNPVIATVVAVGSYIVGTMSAAANIQ